MTDKIVSATRIDGTQFETEEGGKSIIADGHPCVCFSKCRRRLVTLYKEKLRERNTLFTQVLHDRVLGIDSIQLSVFCGLYSSVQKVMPQNFLMNISVV